MSRTRVSLLSLIVDGTPDDVELSAYPDGAMTLRLSDGIALSLEQATPEVLRAVAAAFDTAADLKDQAAIVALNTPAPPEVADNVHTMCVPDWGAA